MKLNTSLVALSVLVPAILAAPLQVVAAPHDISTRNVASNRDGIHDINDNKVWF
jgi:hypothetical protein